MTYLKYKLLYTVILLTAAAYCNAQKNTSLSGKITDAKTGAVLPGASIIIHDINKGVVSKQDGSYQVNNIPPGKYLVEVSYIGYSSDAQTIDLHSAVQKDFALDETAVEKEAVTITGVSSATRIKDNPQPVSIVKREEFVNTTATNTIDALTKLVPGVNAVTTGPAISKPFIRGLGYNRVLTINDNVPQEGQQWGDEHGIEIDDYSVQRIEVLKGPASLMYGSDALAGVINIQSQVPAPEGAIKVNFLSEYQTNNALRGFYGNIAGTKNGFSWNAYGSYKGAQDYKNKYDGYVFNSKFYNKNFGGMVGYGGNWGYSHLLVSNFDQHIGMVEGERDSATGRFIKALPDGEEAIATDDDFKTTSMEIPFQHIRHFKVTSDNNFKVGTSNVDVVVGYQHNQRQEFGNPDDVSTPDAWFDLQTVNYAVRWHLPYNSNWRTSFGVTGMYQTNKNKAEEVLIPNYNSFDIGGFVFTQYTKDKLTLSGGIRYDTRHAVGDPMEEDGEVKFAAFDKNFSNVSGSAGLSYEVSKTLALKANIARGFRAPNFAELSSNGAHEGTNRYEIGNADLKSETSLQGDAGIELTTAHVSLDASLFYNHIHNFIFYERMQNASGGDSLITDAESGDELQVFKFAQQTANLYGAELSLDIHPHPLDWLHFKNTFSYTRGQFSEAIDGSRNIPFVPAARLITALAVDVLRKGNFIRNITAGIESDYNFAQNNPFTGYDTETATPGYWLVGANISADIASKGKTICTLSITGNNLGDIAYQNNLSRFKYLDVNNVTGRQGVFNMGRNFGIKLNVPLSF
ncbi:TonB-dependent receptor [Parafilimonas sp.]|uniref:TonB-dependent receptor n=1 Tax=Parafilimonas sp. TaxID=1969739 RepID=UPI0039E6801E